MCKSMQERIADERKAAAVALLERLVNSGVENVGEVIRRGILTEREVRFLHGSGLIQLNAPTAH